MKLKSRSINEPNAHYVAQVSQEIEGRFAKKLSKEFSKRENRNIGAFAKLGHFLTNPPSSRRTSTPNPKHTSVTSDFHINTFNVQKQKKTWFRWVQVRCYYPRPQWSCSHGEPSVPTRNKEHWRVTFRSTSPSWGRQQKARWVSHQQSRSENTPSLGVITLEADQILVTLQQIANIPNRTHLDNSMNRIAKLPTSLTNTLATFQGK